MRRSTSLWRLFCRAPRSEEETISERILAVTGSYPVVSHRPREKTSRFECYFCERARAHRARKLLADLSPGIARLRHENWAESWKKHFPVQRVGRRLVIKPTWRRYHSRPGDLMIELDPGMSFGTGHHPTTRFCLKSIERLSSRQSRQPAVPRSFLDLGAGSGILAIAAAKLGYAPVRAVDIDPQAVRIARENARLNAVRFPIRTATADTVVSAEPFDVVAANLRTDVLVAQRRRLARLVSHGGHLILAGILEREAGPVRKAFRALGLACFACESSRNWAGFVFRKP